MISSTKMMILTLKDHPELLKIIKAVAPDYRKHKCFLYIAESIELQGTYWDGGSRSSYSAVNLKTFQSGNAQQYAPPQFGGPVDTPRCEIPENVAIVSTGTFCGKTATASITLNPVNAAKLLPAPIL